MPISDTTCVILISTVLLLGLIRLSWCLYGKYTNTEIAWKCPLTSNGIKNTILIMLCLIIIILLLRVRP